MINYEEFKDVIAEEIIAFLPEKFWNSEIKVHEIQKNNETLDALTVTSPDSNVAPTIYLNSYYESYMDGEDLSDILQNIADLRMKYEVDQNLDVTKVTDLSQAKEHILPIVIGAEGNGELLSQRPHGTMDDLAVTYCIELKADETGSARVPITNQIMEMWGISQEELHEIAVSNLETLSPSTFRSMNEVLSEMMLPQMIADCGGNREMAEEMLNSMIPQDDRMFVLTNEMKLNGASALLDDKIMDAVRDKVGDDFYILPSSIHECLVIKAEEGMELQDLENMVQEVNATQVEPKDRLSDHVYQYDGKTHELFRADKAAERQKSAKSVEEKAEKTETRASLKERLAEKKQQIAGERKDPAMGMGKYKEALI
jgi:hypothetical protein